MSEPNMNEPEHRVTSAVIKLLNGKDVKFRDNIHLSTGESTLSSREVAQGKDIVAYLKKCKAILLSNLPDTGYISIECECLAVLRYLRNCAIDADGDWEYALIWKVRTLTMQPAYFEPEPCMKDDHFCCCDCDGCFDPTLNEDRPRPTFPFKKLNRAQLLIGLPGQLYLSNKQKKKGKAATLEDICGVKGEKLIQGAGRVTITVIDNDGKERTTIRCAEEHYQLGSGEYVGNPPKNPIKIRAVNVQIPDPDPKWVRIIDRVSGQAEYRYSERK